MSTKEEPMSVTESGRSEDEEIEVIDLDDVEGHGMREVAAGLGAAAVLAGAGTAAAAAVGVHPTIPGKATTPSISDPIGTVDRATDFAVQTARTTRDAARNTATTQAANAQTTAAELAGQAQETSDRWATGAQKTAGAFVDAGKRLARNTASATSVTMHNARTTASSTAAAASSTASTTASDAAQKTATVLQLTTSTVSGLETTIVATVEDLNPEAGAGTSGKGSTGWVTFSLGGENIASVQVTNGQATVTVKTASLTGKVLQAVYSGDSVHASSMLSMSS